MKRLVSVWGVIILFATIAFHLWLNFPETQITADPNDNIFQYELVARSDWVWEKYDCPFSINCLPNLVDHNVTAWAEGYPLPFYYSHLPQLAIVYSYHMIVKPIVSLFDPQFSLYQYYNWFKYILLCFFPLPIFLALRVAGFSVFASSIGAFFGSIFSTDGLYGIDPPSYLWRGWGLSAQLYAQLFLPLGIAYTYKALKNGNDEHRIRKLVSKEIILASLFLTLTTAGHLGIGVIGLLSTVPFMFLNLKKSVLMIRIKKLMLIYSGLFLVLAYWLIPLLLESKYHVISFWDPIWKFDSYGWYETIRQFVQGEIFDWKRPPIVTGLVTIGFFALLVSERFPFALLLIYWMVLYFGRTTWGGLIDLIPGLKDFHLHRFVIGVQTAGLFLIPAAVEWLENFLHALFERLMRFFMLLKPIISMVTDSQNKTQIDNPRVKASKLESDSVTTHHIEIPKYLQLFAHTATYVILFTFLSISAYFALKQTIDYASYNNIWIKQANSAFKYDEKNFQELLTYLSTKPPGRIYAGRPGNWGREFKLGSSEIYMLLSVYGYDVSQFLPETWSMLSENDQNFDERVATDYDLLNIKYIVAPKNQGFPDSAVLDKKFGPFELYTIQTTGFFDVVTSPQLVKTDKTDYVNLVHLWHRSYARTWNMHPLISVEKDPEVPPTTKRVFQMTDEVSYTENDAHKNIFSDYPFVFPEATVSGQIKSENVNTQTYSAVIDVPSPCTACFVMFKMSYHPNWEARLDGKPVSKHAVFPYYLAVSVTPGVHTVEFTYKPNGFKNFLLWGEILTILGCITWKVRKRIKIVKQ